MVSLQCSNCSSLWKEIGSLTNYIDPGLASALYSQSVANMTTHEGEWRWENFQHLLPLDVLLRIAGVKGPSQAIKADSICWHWQASSNYQFIVWSTYLLQVGISHAPHDIRLSLDLHFFLNSCHCNSIRFIAFSKNFIKDK
ncbi:hypothetical protein V6N13_149366 [Hibiscus sabdariffa]